MHDISNHILRLSSYAPTKRVQFVLQELWPKFNSLLIENAVGKGLSRRNFHTNSICPIFKQTNNEYILEMFYGPTDSFKDIYSLLLPYLISTRSIAVMAAGGSGAVAAAKGFALRGKAKLIIFYPRDSISERHYLELATGNSENVITACVNEKLSDIQSKLDNIAFQNENLTLLHSIALGKTAPLAAIIFSSYCELLIRHEIDSGEPINIVLNYAHSSLHQAIDLSIEIGVPIEETAKKTLYLQASRRSIKEEIEKPIVQDAIVTLSGMESFIKMISC